MKRDRGFLLFCAVVALISAGSLTTTWVPQAAVTSDTVAAAPSMIDASIAPACPGDGQVPMVAPGADSVKPGCCSTQCNVDKDCDKICGKGNCACLQQTPCCRRCVY